MVSENKKKGKRLSTSKIALFTVFVLCIQIILFCEFMMFKTQDISAMYVLIGVPVSLITVVLGYYHKSAAENTAGGIVYDSAMMEYEHATINNCMEG